MTLSSIRLASRRPAVALLALVIVLAACGTVAPTPTPRASVGASGESSPAPGESFVPLPSIELPGEIEGAAIHRHLEALAAIAGENGGVRTAGTPGYDASVDYVAAELRGWGFDVQTPEFRMATFRELPGGTLSVLDGGPTFLASDDFHAMIYSADGDLAAEVATVGFSDSAAGEGRQGCLADDWDGFPGGAIALTPPGPCLRRDTVDNAQEAGAVALVVANEDWEPGQARRPTLLYPDGIEIPVLSAIGEVGEALSAAADDGVEIRIRVDTEIGGATVRNVIAESGGEGPLVMLGAHLDSVHDGPGINDNGSGVAAVLEIAHLVADSQHSGTVRFGFWAAEEFGLLGSRDYVLSLSDGGRRAISAYLNLDMLGSVNAVPMVYRDSAAAPGSSAISDFLLGWLRAGGIAAEPEDLGGGSDHHFFAEAGIPTGGIFSGASERKSGDQTANHGGTAGEPMDPCYHLACDMVANVNADQVAAYAQAAAAAALLLARGEVLPAD